MTYYINTVSLTDVYLRDRNTSDSWEINSKGAARIPFIERTAQSPTNFDIELKFLGAERYNVATSITAEIEQCNEILLRNDNSKKLYGTNEWLWLKQSDFSIVEEEGHRLIGKLSGQIDPYMVHSCDFSTNWTGNGTVSTTTPHNGKQCIKHTVTGPSGSTAYELTYSPASALDLSDCTMIRFWLKSAKASSYYTSVRLFALTDVSNYGYWNITITAADTWYYKTYELASPDSETGTLDLSSVATLKWRVTTSSGTDDIELYVDAITGQ